MKNPIAAISIVDKDSLSTDPFREATTIGDLPRDWKVSTIGSFHPFVTSGSRGWAKYYSDVGAPFIRISNLSHDLVDVSLKDLQCIQLDPVASAEATRTCLNGGDLLISITADIGAIGFVHDQVPLPAYINQHIALVRFDPAAVHSKFAAYVLSSRPVQRIFKASMDVGAKAGMSLITVRKIMLPLPPLPEQEVVAEVLSDIDELIVALEKLIAKKRAIKQATVQQLLTGKTRLPGFTGKWESKRLGDISTIAMGRTPSRNNSKFWGVGHVWLSITDLQSKVVNTSREQITDLAASSMMPISKGTLLMSFKLSIGRLCFAGCDLFTNEAICSFTNLQADAGYLYFALSRTDFSPFGKQAVKGYTLNSESLKLIEVWLPSRTEQSAIAAILSDMDAEIEALERRRDKTKQIKQGMMEQLLTGRIRLVKPQVAVQADSIIKGYKAHNKAFNEAVVIAILTKSFGTESFPLGRKRYTKLSYLLHRHTDGQVKDYLKKAAGPYNPKTKYGGSERIALENGYVLECKRGPYSGFIAAGNVAKAEEYFEKWYGPETIQWLEQFRYKKNDDLELLATVDMAAEGLRAAGKDVSVDGVKNVIRNHQEWQAKLKRPIFSDVNIAKAIDTCQKLFG